MRRIADCQSPIANEQAQMFGFCADRLKAGLQAGGARLRSTPGFHGPGFQSFDLWTGLKTHVFTCGAIAEKGVVWVITKKVFLHPQKRPKPASHGRPVNIG